MARTLSRSGAGALWTAVALLAACQSTPESLTGPGPAVRIAQAVAPSLVRVEYTLKFDKGEPPVAAAWRYQMGNPAEVVEEERPLEHVGYVLSPTRVVTLNLLVHPRFIDKIVVREGNKVIEARPAAYGVADQAVFLDLAQPLTAAKPLAFGASAQAPYFAVRYAFVDGAWTTDVGPVGGTVEITEDGRKFRTFPGDCLITDKAGAPVAVFMRDRLPLDDSFKVTPDKWPTIPAPQMTAMLDDLQKRAAAGLLRVTLSFRSPKQGRNRMGPDDYTPGDYSEGQGTDRDVVGVLVDAKTVLVTANLRATVTARLDKVRVYDADGKPVSAQFAGTLTDYGGLVVRLDKPLPGPLTMRDGPITDLRDDLLLGVDLSIRGEQRVAYCMPARIAAFEKGRRSDLFPQVMATGQTYLFDRQCRLVTLPMALRSRGSDNEDRWREYQPLSVPAARLAAVVADLPHSVDKFNVPLSEEEENRLAWLGVELQPLGPELARANKVSDQTMDGRTGAIVNFVYPDSPADKAGLKDGDILLRLRSPDRPKPMEVRLMDRGFGGDEPFPWDQLDQIPERYYDQIPSPWPSADNTVNRLLTDLGFGKKATLEYVRDGKTLTHDLVVTQSPPYYDTATKFKSEPLGVTVRDLTYEVLRYFQRTPEAGGVIVSKIEAGGKVSVAGLKPYEIVTHVNDKPVLSVNDFEKAVSGGGELRLSVKRMTKGRIVKVTVEAATTKPAQAGK